MTVINLQDRLSKVSGDELPTNCIGTALFLVGEVETDEHVEPVHARKHFEKLTKITLPELGSIITWEEDTSRGITVEHAGIVVGLNPLLVTHRPGCYEMDCNAKVVHGANFSDVNKIYRDWNTVNRYYRPSSRIII